MIVVAVSPGLGVSLADVVLGGGDAALPMVMGLCFGTVLGGAIFWHLTGFSLDRHGAPITGRDADRHARWRADMGPQNRARWDATFPK